MDAHIASQTHRRPLWMFIAHPGVRILQRPSFRSRFPLLSRAATPRSHGARLVTSAAATGAPSTETASAATHTLKVVLYSARPGLKVKVQIVSQSNADDRSQQWVIEEPSGHTHQEVDETGGYKCGHTIDIQLDNGFQPGAILMSMEPRGKEQYQIYVSILQLIEKSSGVAVNYLVDSNMHKDQGQRPFFPDSLTLPAFDKGTPAGIQPFRANELEAFKGTAEDRKKERKTSDRIYDFDVYNDLGGTDPKKPKELRPTLGGETLKYPRRLRTGRELKDGREVAPESGKLPWLPMDERFNAIKFKEFQSGAKGAVGEALRGVLGTPRGLSFALSLKGFIDRSKNSQIFRNFSIYDTLFKELSDADMEAEEKSRYQSLSPFDALTMEDLLIEMKDIKSDTGLTKALLLGDDPDSLNAVIDQKLTEMRNPEANSSNGNGQVAASQKATATVPEKNKFIPNPEFEDVNPNLKRRGFGEIWDSLKGAGDVFKYFLEHWPSPRSRMTRALEWRSDDNFARTFLSGQNPLSIRAMTQQDLATFKVRDHDLRGLLEGKTLEQALSEGRLFCVDYHTGYIDFVERVAELRNKSLAAKNKDELFDNVLYAGRCVFYKRNHGPLSSISIELETDDHELTVYTPNNCSEVWFMAKTVIASLDSGIHQLISHWLTTHACVEAMAISTRRELSILHPLYKLLEPHYRYTLRINCNARAALISSGGIIESCFTPGPFSMELSSKVYEGWRFNQQSFPADLLHRGMAVEKDGKLEILVENYSYAEDGLLVWNAILKFAKDYLSLYYDDNKNGQRVKDDVEITNWWRSVQKEGHEDITEGWPEIDSVDSLANVAATIMWTASAHHAAVNFGQYDNAAFVPNRPSKIRKKIPVPGTRGETTREETILRDRFEEEFFKTVSDTLTSVLVMSTVQILSAHASDEEYLDRDDHKFIKDAAGAKVHEQFVEDLREAEKVMHARNEDWDKRMDRGRGMAYTLLMPSLGGEDPYPDPAIRPPARGIPYSISI